MLPRYDIGPGADLSGLRDVGNALASYQRGHDQRYLQQQREAEQARQAGRENKQDALAEEKRLGQRFANMALAAKTRPPEQRRAMLERYAGAYPGFAENLAKYGMDYNDTDAVLDFLIREGGGDPMELQQGQLDLQKTQAEIGKLNRDSAAGGETPSNVREYEYFKNLPPEEKQRYLTMKRADKYLDTGTQFIQPNAIDLNAAPRVIQKDISEAERQKTVGRETGERQMGAPKALAALDAADAKTGFTLDKIKEARQLVGPYTTGMGSLLSSIPGTQARNLSAIVDTLKANAGFNELQSMRDNSPTGGALGQVAVQELQLLQSVITSLDSAQTAQQFNRALDNYQQFLQGSRERRRAAYEATYGAYTQQQPAQPSGAGRGDAGLAAPSLPQGWSIRRID